MKLITQGVDKYGNKFKDTNKTVIIMGFSFILTQKTICPKAIQGKIHIILNNLSAKTPKSLKPSKIKRLYKQIANIRL